MNRTIKHIILFSFLLFQSIFSFAGNCIDEIGKKLGTGNAAAVATHFDKNLSLSVAGGQGTYSSAQAEMILNDFLKNKDVTNVSIERSGNNNSCNYAIGKLTTSKGDYRLYMVVKGGKDCIIKELRLEK